MVAMTNQYYLARERWNYRNVTLKKGLAMTKKYKGIDAATVACLKDGVTNFTQEDARYYMSAWDRSTDFA